MNPQDYIYIGKPSKYDVVTPMIQNIKTQIQESVDRGNRLRSADARVNRKTKAPMKLDNTAKLQDQLWHIGAFKGVKDRRGRESTYDTAVDGIRGIMTNTAIANAQRMGYTLGNNGLLSKKSTPVKTSTKTDKVPIKTSPQQASIFGIKIPNFKLPSFGSSKSEKTEDRPINLEGVLDHKRRYNVKGRSWYFDPTTNTGYRIEGSNVAEKFEIGSGLNMTSDGYTPLSMDNKGRPLYDRSTNLSSTPGGIFTFSKPGAGYGEVMYSLVEGQRGEPGTKGKSTNVAFHSPADRQRAAALRDNDVNNNRVSFGCIYPRKGQLTKWDKELGSFTGDSVYVQFKDPRNYIKEKNGVLQPFINYAPKEVSGKNYDKPYHFTDVKYNRGY